MFGQRPPRVVAIIPSYIASCQINVVKPLSALDRAGQIKFKHVLEHKANLSHVRWADIIVLCRNTEPSFGYLISEAIGRNKPVIYDIDDSFWDIQEATDPELARYHLQPLRLRQLEQYLSHASLVRVYSQLLKNKIRRFNERVEINRSAFDFSLLPDRDNQRTVYPKVSIVYATSRIVDDQYRIFLPALSEFLTRHHGTVSFTVWGCSPPELLNLPGVQYKKLTAKYDDFLKEFSRANFDIGLAPLQDNEFNRSKNNTKFRDYGACKIAGIYSNLDVYSASVRHGENGLLVENTTESWQNALNRLAFDRELRETITKNAFENVYKGYRQELIEKQWLDNIQELLEDVPSFWVSRLNRNDFVELNVHAENDNLCGVKISSDIVKEKVFLEIRSPNGRTLRSLTSSVKNIDERDGSITFQFQPLRNSAHKALNLRLSGAVTKQVQLIYA